ncbi:MAG: putative membrane protein YphA (DoxX/SURF4 family) [Crocinitomicaceae bacterium]|jgi:uncharacterized membrane protein YphA (DoxX/SURF4 family)
MISFQDIAELWDSFFFDRIPVHSLAIFRIGLALVLLIDTVYNLLNLKEYFGPNGIVSYDSYRKKNGKGTLSLFLILPATMRSVYLVIGLHITFLLMVLLGLFTPISVLLAFITLRSTISRNSSLCNGGDSVAKLMCWLLIFAPCGYAYSLDEYFFYALSMPDQEYLMQAPWVLRLMQIQVSIIYIYTVYWKLKGKTWRNGTAIYYAMNSEFYRRFKMPKPFLKTPFVQAITWSVLLAEFGIGMGIWIEELRYPMIAVGIVLHLVFEYTMNVHLFSWYMMMCLILFIDPTDIYNFISGIIS